MIISMRKINILRIDIIIIMLSLLFLNLPLLHLLFGRGRRKPPETSTQVQGVDFRRICA